jgi:kynurenine formamidase
VNLHGATLVDLSVHLGPSPSEHVPVSIEYMPHALGGAHLAELTGVNQRDLCGGLGWASERVCAITHSGTHIDAPFHYAPQCAGKPTRTIDVLPLRWFIGESVCIDARGCSGEVRVEDVLAFESRAEVRLTGKHIVLFYTGAGPHYGTSSYGESGLPISPQTVEFLCQRGVRVIGTDAWSIDPPVARMRARAAVEGGSSVWQAHYVGRKYEFCVVEKLTNLDCLPETGFIVVCFPVKIKNGSAGWTRAVAIL